MFSQANSNALLHDCEEATPTACNKETGEKRRLQKWSRGHFFIVRGSGIIDKWNPLFRYMYIIILLSLHHHNCLI